MQSQRASQNRHTYVTVRIPSVMLECACYFCLLYSLMAEAFGASVPLLAGVMVLGTAGICILQLLTHAKTVYAPIRWLIACAISFVLVQVVFHEVSILDESVRPFIIWILQMITVYSLCLRRGFTFRYPLVLFCLAVATLPFITSTTPGEIERARVDVELGVQGNLSHPNGLAEWFGFLAVYFAISGLETSRFAYRIGAWVAAIGSLLVVGLTVGRGPMLAAALAITFGFRGLLRRGFVPVFVLILLGGIAFGSGIFDRAVSNYEERALEESGREVLWPAAIETIFNSPLGPFIGVGVSKVGLYAMSAIHAVPPHNSFLYFGLSSGMVPLAFYFAFWVQATWRSLHVKGQEGDAFRIPYLIFTFVVVMLGDLGFMSPWALLALSVSAGSAVVYRKQRLSMVRFGGKTKYAFFPEQKPSEPSTVAQ